MKYTLTLLVIFFMKISTYAQIDSLNYIKQFEINKANYIGKPFSKLLNDMTQIQPKTVWPSTNFRNKHINFSTRYKFCSIEQSFHNVIILDVIWQTPVNATEAFNLGNLNHFYFTNDERVYYGSKIIKDIKVYR